MMLSIYAAYLLRFDFVLESRVWSVIPYLLVIYVAVMLPWLIYNQLYRRIWTYASIGDLISIFRGVAIGTAVLLALATLAYLITGRIYVPSSILLIAPTLTFLGIAASRFVWRLLRDGYTRDTSRRKRRVLIIGAGEAGFIVARELRREKSEYYPVAFIDDDPTKYKQNLLGIPVVGDRYAIPMIAEKLKIEEIILALPSAKRNEITKILNICKQTNLQIKIIPSVNDMVNGKFTISRLRNVELEDLLGREPVKVDLEEIAGYLEGRVVLITGAGGSIGSELCRQVIRFHPLQLILVGRGENSIYEIESELRSYTDLNVKIDAVIADIQDHARMKVIFETYQPEVVFHAAAHKHVPLMELQPIEAIKNNILGTHNMVELAHAYSVERFVMISTDKAVNPTNVMGASKRVAELIVKSKDQVSETLFATVRFGNVLGSRGSVIPRFRKQIEAGGPVTVTHPDMMRYFMTIPEAVQLVIQAGALSQGGETFVLDMGEPVKIVDLARDLIRLSGFTEKEIPIQYSGIRPGEKLFEELLTEEEGTMSTVHNRIFIARSETLTEAEMESMIASFNWIVQHQDTVKASEVKELLKLWVPSYTIQNISRPLTEQPSIVGNEANYGKLEVAAAGVRYK